MTSSGRRRALWTVSGLGLVVLVGLVVVLVAGGLPGSDDEGRPATRPADRGEPAPGQEPTRPGGAYAPQSERRFVRVGTTTGQQFTDEELRFLADNFEVVLFTKFHGGYDINMQHDAARRLVAMKPGIQVYPYFSTKYWFPQNRWNGAVVDPAWLLRDDQGNLVDRDRRRDRDRETDISYVDLANPDYRQWALGVLSSWLDAAPYAGISFDAAEPIGDYGERDVARWEKTLGPERLAAYNEGLRQLLAAADKLVGPDRDVVFNGIAPSPARGPGRNLDLLEVTDGALDERFCLDARGEVRAIEADLTLLADQADSKRLFLRTNYLDTFEPAQRDRYQRLCLGVFLLGWQPGQSYFQFGGDYTADQLDNDPPDLSVNLGRPSGPYRPTGDLREREFENGVLYVNVGADPATVVVDAPLTEVRGGRVIGSHRPGDSVTVGAGDSAFLLRSAVVGQGPGG